MKGLGREKLSVCFGGGLVERNCHCGMVCALRDREATSLSLEKKDRIYLTWMLAWRRNLWIIITAQSARAEFIVTIMITSADWLGLHARKSATVHYCPH